MPEILLVMTALGGLIATAELLHRWTGVRAAHTRRMVHLGTGLAVVSFPYLFESAGPVYVLAGTFVLINGAALISRQLPGMHDTDRVTWGTVTFPLALLVVLPVTWSPDQVFALQTAFLLLAICDPLASWIGENAGPRAVVSVDSRRKSITGSVSFFVSAVLVTVIAGYVLNTWPTVESTHVLLAVGVIVGLVATAAEFLGGAGWDNLFIVTAVVVVLVAWQMHPTWWSDLSMGIGVGLLFGLVAWQMNYLTVSGAAAGGLFAATLVGLGGWPWAVPGFAFFFLSSVLSKLGRSVKTGTARTLTGRDRRTEGQVYANGGVAWGTLIGYTLVPDSFFYWAFLGAIAAAAADTWASEIGPLVGRKARMILSGELVQAGTSGAVSAAGTLGGLVGAGVIWGAAFAGGSQAIVTAGPVWSLIVLLFSGTVGSVVDSLVGASVQAIYREPGSGRYLETSEEVDEPATLVRGWRWIDNERVNWMCTAAGALSAMLLGALG